MKGMGEIRSPSWHSVCKLAGIALLCLNIDAFDDDGDKHLTVKQCCPCATLTDMGNYAIALKLLVVLVWK